jgi:hypothetical protein
MLRRMVNLRQLGARAHLYDASGGDIGFCHLPLPVVIGDLAALENAIFRVVGVVDGVQPGDAIDALVLVERCG